ncbi:alpha/beta hydrolase [Streptomyces sp. NBC_01485]|uniref:alpha/beta hydrolase n=1 Tax=Streptomyces sp. NBC_01485 TaxID=2903884 RepID=UPI002E326A53|nr:alpha/beta hydrolase fold domain-containing protein [Streptomyces sp. NBC_01485]
MPLDPYLADKVALVADVTREEALNADEALWDRFNKVFNDNRPYAQPEVNIREESVEGFDGLRVRVYTPSTGVRPGRQAFVWAHGGGFVAGTLDDHEADTVSRDLCARADVVVVSVDYPLANGSTVRYPTLHRALAEAFRWTLRNAAELGVDADTVVLGGASAGGNLTVAATMELRDNGERVPARLILVYPALSATFTTDEQHEKLMAGVPPLFRFEQEAIGSIFHTYAAGETDTPYLSFENMASLGELPPMLVILSEYDDLRPPAEAVLARAEQDGLRIERYLAHGVLHGHLSMLPLLPETRSTLDRMTDYLRR